MPSRDFVDGEIEKIRHCVIPICGEDVHKRPCLLGSAVLIRLGSADVLVTAAHILSDNDGVPLFVFGADGFGHWLTGEFTLDTKEDLAALCLAPEMSAKLSHVSPLPVALVAEITEQRFYGTVVGYPASSSKRPQKGKASATGARSLPIASIALPKRATQHGKHRLVGKSSIFAP